MHCSKCGYDNTDDAPYCAQCGEPLFMRAKHPTHEQGARKVVKLPSDGSEIESAPIERPWEVRVPKRNAGKPGNSGKMPPARKASGKTGRMSAVRPDAGAKGGSEPAQGDEPESKAISGASIGGAAAETLILKPAPGPGETRPDPTPRQRLRNASPAVSVKSSSGTRGGGNGGKGRFAIIIALILVACAIAAAIFFLTAPKASRVVTFDTDGGSSVAEQTIIDGGKLERPTSPTRDGYTFSGWYLDPNFNDPAYFPVTVTEDMTLYAKWSVKSATASTSSSANAQTEGSNANSGATSSGGSGSKAGAGGSSGGSAGGSSGGSGSGSGTGSGSGSGGGTSGGGSSSDVNSDPASNGPVPITLIASNGATLTGTVTLHDGYVIPDSSTKAYSISELRALGLNDAELCIARNEPYARQGYSFRNPGLQAYFNARSWYHNTGWRGELPEDSAGYITAHNLLALAQESPSARQWLSLRTY